MFECRSQLDVWKSSVFFKEIEDYGLLKRQGGPEG